eukprot:COSAG05_NODE_12628_length_460_cov_2.875346_1_plen_106_part_01
MSGCVGKDTAVTKLKINLDSVNLERGNISIGGVTGHSATCVGRANGVPLYFDKQRLVVDLYVLKDWSMGVDMLFEAYNKGAGAITSFCGACIGGIAHKRWCQVENT